MDYALALPGVGYHSLIAADYFGIFLPILPTTPFYFISSRILLLAYKAPKDSMFLLGNRITGPIIYEWCMHRSIPRRQTLGLFDDYFVFGSSIVIVVKWYGSN